MTIVGMVIGAIVVVLIVLGWAALVRTAKTGSRGAYAIGAAMMLLGIGNVRDPDSQLAHEAERHRPKKSNESGDPPTANGK